MTFQKIILTISVIALIIILIIIGMGLSKGAKDISWPPIVGECPDYWVDINGNGESCLNTHSLGKCNVPSEGEEGTMNFNQAPFTGDNGDCAKYRWATTCKVTWDGITSGVKNPCDTSDTQTE